MIVSASHKHHSVQGADIFIYLSLRLHNTTKIYAMVRRDIHKAFSHAEAE